MLYRSQPGLFPLFPLLFAYLLGGGNIACQKLVAESYIGAVDDRLSQLRGQSQHEMDVVDAAQAQIQVFVGLNEMAQVARTVVAAGVTGAVGLNRPLLAAVARTFDVDASIVCEEATVTGHARR